MPTVTRPTRRRDEGMYKRKIPSDLPKKISNIKLAFYVWAKILGGYMCLPHERENPFYRSRRSWKRYRKTQYKEG
jgi:hypothetical protein